MFVAALNTRIFSISSPAAITDLLLFCWAIATIMRIICYAFNLSLLMAQVEFTHNMHGGDHYSNNLGTPCAPFERHSQNPLVFLERHINHKVS